MKRVYVNEEWCLIPLRSLDFDLLAETATSAAFSSDIRRKKFGGMV